MKFIIKPKEIKYSVYKLYKALKPFDDKDMLLGYIFEQMDQYNKANNWCLVDKALYIESPYAEDNEQYNMGIEKRFKDCELPKEYIQKILFNYVHDWGLSEP
ncbi:hypothetical protein [Succinivibrio dextrinosolvens]|uniref:hypothetical protein n=1 Tax=Succinivibrio dextrinosolvens TaxID=83771 RepID=UPI0004E12B2C|nr:hypothetical protein [Succinivibrio dextrinosolvens]